MADGPEDSRLRALRSTQLLDSAPERAFDRLTRLASGLLAAPVALVSLVDERRQFFKSALGLKEPWASLRGTPLTHSFCQYATRDRLPLIVNDAREHPVLRDNLAIRDLGVVAYAGVPLLIAGEAIGALCVIDDKPRVWSQEEVRLLEDLAESVVSEIELRLSSRAEQAQRALTAALIESLGDAVLAVDTARTFLVANAAARRIFAHGAEAGQPLPTDWSARHGSRRADGSALAAEEGALGRGLRGEDTNDLTFSLQRTDSSERLWVEASGRPVRDADGKVVAAVAVYRDVTAKKIQLDTYTALAANIPRGAVALFDQNLRCLALNGGLSTAGESITPQNSIGKTMRELAALPVGEEERFDRIEEMYRRTIAGQSLADDFVHGETTLALKTAPVRDGLGRITAGIVLALDVTTERRLEAGLRHSEQIHRAIVKHLPNGGVFMVDRDLRYVSADGPAVANVMRLAKLKDLVGHSVMEVTSDENKEAVLDVYQSTLRGEFRHSEFIRGDRVFDVNTVPIFEGARVSHALLFLYDITERKREAEALAQARDLLTREQALFEATVANIEDGVALLDSERRILLANQAYVSMFGLPRARLEELSRAQFIHHVRTLLVDPTTFVELECSQTPREEFVFARPRRRILRRSWTRVALPPATDSFLVTWHDVTAERDLSLERERQLLVDALTGIANRRAAEAALTVEMARMKRAGTLLCVAFFDIDHFKGVNDLLGHKAGDEVLCQVAATLAAQARITDTVARWGGEEFLAVLPGSLEGARAFCERARLAVAGLRFSRLESVTVSAGIAEIAFNEPASVAIARADERLYEAKGAGRNCVRA